MADAPYQNQNFILTSKGIVARNVTDACEPGQFLALTNCEELAENSEGNRLGTSLVNAASHAINAPCYPLPGKVYALAKLSGLDGNAWRYAGAGGNLYRRDAAGQGAYELLASNMSAGPWQSQNASPTDITGVPFIFFADSEGMLKDNGTLATPQQIGIFQPVYPVSAQSQEPDLIVLDSFLSSAYTTSGTTTFDPNQTVVATTLAEAVTETGIQEVAVSDPTKVGQFQSLVIDSGANQETVLVLFVTATGFIANFKKTHSLGIPYSMTTRNAIVATGIQFVGTAGDTDNLQVGQQVTVDSGINQEIVTILVVDTFPEQVKANFTKTHANGVSMTWVAGSPVDEQGLVVSVAASATATLSNSFAGKPISIWPTILNQEDYIGLYLYVSDPTQVLSITLKFDCGDGTFDSDYFFKVIAQGPLQQVLASSETGSSSSSTSTPPTTWLTGAVLDESLGLYNNSAGGIAQLNTGLNNWTPLLLQLSDFAGSGRANFSDPVFNWQAVNGYQLTIVMNDGSSATVQLASLVMFGGFGPDTFAGVAYDYLMTFYNNVDGTESNPCMVMSNVNPPNDTNFVYPRRQPVLLTLTYPELDPQTTSLRLYRRGGTLGDNYRRLDEVLLTGSPQKYLDVMTDADIEQSDFVSFTNDVPVTSSLQTPVNTTLLAAIATTNSLVRVRPVSMANISIAQQVSIGTIGSLENNFETVIVISLVYAPGDPKPNSFMAFVQNSHLLGEQVTATAQYGQPVTIMAQAFGQMWFSGDPNNPNYLYWSSPNLPQAVSSAAYVQVSTPDDPITAIVQFKGNLYVSTIKGWWSVAPGSNQNASPTIYPTASKHGCVAPLGFVATEEAIFYCAVDGIRAFAGGASEYLTQGIEFIFQGVGSSPIVEADQTQLSQTRMAYWNNQIYLSYIGVDGNRHRVILHTVYRRWRNDDLDVQSILLESDTNLLVFGDSQGLVHLDRQIQAFDEGNDAGVLVQLPILMNLQSPFSDQGMPAIQKNYNEPTLDVLTNGQELTLTLLFNDGEESLVVGAFSSTEREKINFVINEGDGYQAYKVSLQITGAVTQPVYIFQAGIRYLPLPKTRRSIDTYALNLGIEDSKFAKNVWWQYTATQPINFDVYYDGEETPSFNFTLPTNTGIRNAMRVRLPAKSFRFIRMVGESSGDFMVWTTSKIEFKPQGTGKGYQVIEFVPD